MDRRTFLAMAALPALNPLRGQAQTRKTEVTIRGDAFLINGRPTYAGRTFNGKRVEGLLMNIRAVQGIFDDLNPETAARWVYPDTKQWDPDRNTTEFLAAMPEWKRHGVLAFTINLQGGSPGFAGGRGRRGGAAGAGAQDAPGATPAPGTATAAQGAGTPPTAPAGSPAQPAAAATSPAAEGRGSCRKPPTPPETRDEAGAEGLWDLSSRTRRSIPRAISGRHTWRACNEFSTVQTSSGWWRSWVTSTSGRTSA